MTMYVSKQRRSLLTGYRELTLSRRQIMEDFHFDIRLVEQCLGRALKTSDRIINVTLPYASIIKRREGSP